MPGADDAPARCQGGAGSSCDQAAVVPRPSGIVIMCLACDPISTHDVKAAADMARSGAYKVVLVPFGDEHKSQRMPALVSPKSFGTAHMSHLVLGDYLGHVHAHHRFVGCHIALDSMLSSPSLCVRAAEAGFSGRSTVDVVDGILRAHAGASAMLVVVGPDGAAPDAVNDLYKTWAPARRLRIGGEPTSVVVGTDTALLSFVRHSADSWMSSHEQLARLCCTTAWTTDPSFDKLVPAAAARFYRRWALHPSMCGSRAATTRVAVLGGSFDPFTEGHGHVVREVLDSKLADEVWVVPCGPRPDKPSLKTPAEVRFLLSAMAVEDLFPTRSDVFVSDVEVARGRALSAHELLTSLSATYRGRTFSLVIGSDLLPSLTKWQLATRLLEECAFLVVERPGYDTDRSTLPPHSSTVPMSSSIDVSSTDVRKLSLSGAHIDGLVSQMTRTHILKYSTYSAKHSRL